MDDEFERGAAAPRLKKQLIGSEVSVKISFGTCIEQSRTGQAGVKEYKLTYYTQITRPKIRTSWQLSGHAPAGVPPEEAGAAVAGVLHRYLDNGLDGSADRHGSLQGRCYDIEPVAGEDNQYICYVAYPWICLKKVLSPTC